MKLYDVNAPVFREYGRVCKEDFSGYIKALIKRGIPSGVEYEPSVPELEETISSEDAVRLFGGLPMEAGYCSGHNRTLNAVEYHRNSEINVAATDAILILGRLQDVTEEYTYDTSKMLAFFVPAGTAVELYATTLHYAPCQTSEMGFMVGVILPKGTNTELGEDEKVDPLLAARNKWLIGHKEAELPEGTFLGLAGENLTV